MANTVRGEFEVKLAPLPTHDTAEGSTLGRRSIDKTFHGDLAATSVGEMLSAMDFGEGVGRVRRDRAGHRYPGREGGLVRAHAHRGDEPGRAVPDGQVVPDSGTDGLAGLTGHDGDRDHRREALLRVRVRPAGRVTDRPMPDIFCPYRGSSHATCSR